MPVMPPRSPLPARSSSRGRFANTLLRLEAAYREKEDLILVGAYQKGSDPLVDAAIALREQSLGFLQQRPDEVSKYDMTRATLVHLGNQIAAKARRVS